VSLVSSMQPGSCYKILELISQVERYIYFHLPVTNRITQTMLVITLLTELHRPLKYYFHAENFVYYNFKSFRHIFCNRNCMVRGLTFL